MVKMDKIAGNLKNTNRWLRAVFALLFFIFFKLAAFVFWWLVIFQVIFSLVTGNANKNVIKFLDSLRCYISQVLSYVSYGSDNKPFPFGDWPGTDNYVDIEAEGGEEVDFTEDAEKPQEKTQEKPQEKTIENVSLDKDSAKEGLPSTEENATDKPGKEEDSKN